MIAFLSLAAFALAVATIGATVMARATWPEHAPRLALATWLVLAGSVVVSALLAGLVLAVPVGPLSGDLASLLHTCVTLVREQYATPGGALSGVLGFLGASGMLVRLGWCAASDVLAARTGRAKLRDQLALVARPDHRIGALVVEHTTSAAYCVPGGRGRIVVTSAALDRLDADQVSAVVAHERSHLRGRHHVLVQSMVVLRRAFPFVPAFRHAADEVAQLTELVADDVASRTSGRLALATALVRLAEGATPVGTLAAGGQGAVARVRRLADPVRPVGLASRVGILTALTVMVMVPVLVSAGPALAVAAEGYCPLPVGV